MPEPPEPNRPEDAVPPLAAGRLGGAAAGSAPRGTTASERFRSGAASLGASSMDDHENEQKVWEGGYSPRAMTGPWLLCAVASVLLIAAGILIEFEAVPWWSGVAVALLLWLGVLAIYFWRRWGVHYELTTQRFIHQSGVLRRRTDRIEVIEIDDVSFEQGPVQRILGIGKIHIISSDRSHPTLDLLGIANVKEVAGMIDDVRRRERRKRSLHIASM